jgi:hypothetical protein
MFERRLFIAKIHLEIWRTVNIVSQEAAAATR